MGRTERKEKEKEIRRNDIIDAAERVFLKKAFTATMEDIAAETEFTKKTIYSYFGSKEEIYFEIMIRGYHIMLDKIQTSLLNVQSNNAEGKIYAIASAMFDFKKENPVYFKAIMEYENEEADFIKSASVSSKDTCYQIGEEILIILKNIIIEGQKEGSLREDLDPDKTTLLLWMFMLGVFHTIKKKQRYILHYHGADEKELLEEAVNLLWKSIATCL